MCTMHHWLSDPGPPSTLPNFSLSWSTTVTLFIIIHSMLRFSTFRQLAAGQLPVLPLVAFDCRGERVLVKAKVLKVVSDHMGWSK